VNQPVGQAFSGLSFQNNLERRRQKSSRERQSAGGTTESSV
jgi:hypothetical protein